MADTKKSDTDTKQTDLAAKAAASSAPAAPTQVDYLSVKTGDASAVLTVNGTQFALTPSDVYQAKRAIEFAYFALH